MEPLKIKSQNLRIHFLRGISILLVLIHHFDNAYSLKGSAFSFVLPLHLIECLGRNGYYAVTLFFCISGFLITTLALDRHKKFENLDVTGFYIRRFARIYPSLLFFLAVVILIHFSPWARLQNEGQAPSVSLGLAVFSVLTFWHNVLMAKAGWFNYCLNILWSLSVEEVFYFIFPISCLVLRKERFLIPFWIGLILLSPIYRTLHLNDEMIGFYSNLACFDAIAWGCLAAVLARKPLVHAKIGTFSVQVLAGIALALIYFYKPFHSFLRESAIFGISFMALATSILLIGAFGKTSFPVLSKNTGARWICSLGSMSYELYLFHVIVLLFMKGIFDRQELGAYGLVGWLATYFGLSILVSKLVYQFWSKPMNEGIRLYAKKSKGVKHSV